MVTVMRPSRARCVRERYHATNVLSLTARHPARAEARPSQRPPGLKFMRRKRTRDYGVPVACATTTQSLPPQDDADFAASQGNHFVMKFVGRERGDPAIGRRLREMLGMLGAGAVPAWPAAGVARGDRGGEHYILCPALVLDARSR